MLFAWPACRVSGREVSRAGLGSQVQTLPEASKPKGSRPMSGALHKALFAQAAVLNVDLRQHVSICMSARLETLFAQAAVLGVDLRQHSRFNLAPGGVRELTLALEPYDASPRQMSCPNPPSCIV
eukprot:scaffold271141_cov18-Tisochrysis_lutea.AAC.1